jgi:PhnB protein
MSTIQPYVFFEGRAEEAAEFYGQVLGAKVEMLMRYADSPDPIPAGMVPKGSERKVMHMALTIGDSMLLGSDGNCSGQPKFGGFSLSYTAATEADAERVFAQLAKGGQVRMPLGKTFFSPKFGMVADKFGVGWMVIVPAPMPR